MIKSLDKLLLCLEHTCIEHKLVLQDGSTPVPESDAGKLSSSINLIIVID